LIARAFGLNAAAAQSSVWVAGTLTATAKAAVPTTAGGIPNPMLLGHLAATGMAADGTGAAPASILRADSAVLFSAFAAVRAANPWQATATKSPPSAYLAMPALASTTIATSAVHVAPSAMMLLTFATGG
jgi:hypothetical protein